MVSKHKVLRWKIVFYIDTQQSTKPFWVIYPYPYFSARKAIWRVLARSQAIYLLLCRLVGIYTGAAKGYYGGDRPWLSIIHMDAKPDQTHSTFLPPAITSGRW